MAPKRSHHAKTVEADADQTFDYTYPTSLSISGLTLALDRDKGQPSADQISTITLTYFDMNDNGKNAHLLAPRLSTDDT